MKNVEHSSPAQLHNAVNPCKSYECLGLYVVSQIRRLNHSNNLARDIIIKPDYHTSPGESLSNRFLWPLCMGNFRQYMAA